MQREESTGRVMSKRDLRASSFPIAGVLVCERPPENARRSHPLADKWDYEDGVVSEMRAYGFVFSDEQPNYSHSDRRPPSPDTGQYFTARSQTLPIPTDRGDATRDGPSLDEFRSLETPPPVVHTTSPAPQGSAQLSEEVATTVVKKQSKRYIHSLKITRSLLGMSEHPSKLTLQRSKTTGGQARQEDEAQAAAAPDMGKYSAYKSSGQDVGTTQGTLADLGNPVVKQILSRSSTTSTVEEWLGVKKSKSDLRLVDLAEQQRPAPATRGSSDFHSLPRISSFRTESEHRALGGVESVAETIVPEHGSNSGTQSTTPARKERPRFLRSLSKRSVSSVPTLSGIGSGDAIEPPLDTLALDEMSVAQSPGQNFSGFIRQPRRKVHEDITPGPMLAKSRRRGTGAFDEITPMGRPEFKVPDMRPVRSPLPTYPSSPISPGDSSMPAQNHHMFPFFQKAVANSISQANLKLQPPPQRHPRRILAQEFLPSEARRVNTPPEVKPGKGNRLMGHVRDSWSPGASSKTSATDNAEPIIHVSFPMPDEYSPLTGNPLGAPSPVRTRGADWYRERADQILGDEQPRDLEELRAMFDWDIPEHLPNSPLCPANPKHPSGGTGVCVYHGSANARFSY